MAQSGNALALCRQVADTEGGRVFIAHRTNSPGTLVFLQRGASVVETTEPDLLAPGPPTGVRAVAAQNTITLSWQAPATGGAVANYHAEWREDDTGAYSSVTTVQLTYVIRNLSPNTLYGYRVRANNATDNSSYVTGTIRTLAAVLAVPGVVRNLAAVSPSTGTVNVSWDAPNVGGAVATYSLRYRRTGTTSWTQTVTGLTTRARSITGLSNSTPLDIEVQAVNASGGSTWVRTTVTTHSGVVPMGLPIPTGLDIGSDFGSLAQLTWNAVTVPDGETLLRYQARYKAVSQEHWTLAGTTTGTRQFISGLQAGSQYEFQVRAEYQSGQSGFSPSHTWTAGSAATDPNTPSSGVLYLENLPIFLTDLPITIEDS